MEKLKGSLFCWLFCNLFVASSHFYFFLQFNDTQILWRYTLFFIKYFILNRSRRERGGRKDGAWWRECSHRRPTDVANVRALALLEQARGKYKHTGYMIWVFPYHTNWSRTSYLNTSPQFLYKSSPSLRVTCASAFYNFTLNIFLIFHHFFCDSKVPILRGGGRGKEINHSREENIKRWRFIHLRHNYSCCLAFFFYFPLIAIQTLSIFFVVALIVVCHRALLFLFLATASRGRIIHYSTLHRLIKYF